eukprot:Nitzschia sp. Nitz4//scaffold159_size51929//23805//26847//NITZ4_006878-RA/size51929-augustus-gene-0.80-mRNA-1//-1//CDS//3329537571//4992//frame0
MFSATNHRWLEEEPARVIDDIGIHSLLSGTDDNTDDVSGMYYEPSRCVENMHTAPRFGHSNRLGLLTSSDTDDAMDYAQGLKQFTLFVVVPFVIWGIFLILFKCVYGIPKIGCAAGGEILDMKDLSRKGISRKERKRRVIRSWRVQSTFMVCSVFVPIVSVFMMQSGWGQIQTAWTEVQDMMDDVESLAYRGWHAMDGLYHAQTNLTNNKLVQAVVQSDTASIFQSWCPDAANSDSLDLLQDAMDSLQSNTDAVVEFLNLNLPNSADAFIAVTEATTSVDESIQWFFSHDWVWKMYLMVLNVLNVFMLVYCYAMVKNNVIHPPTRMYLAFFIVPLFTVATFLILMVTASSGVASLVNADFCAGGEAPGSPQGTIEDAILSYQFGTLDRSNAIAGTAGITYLAFDYYANGCLTENPLAFLSTYVDRVDEAIQFVSEVATSVPDTKENAEMLSSLCGADVSFLPHTIQSLQTELESIKTDLGLVISLSSCESVSPLIRRLTYGAVCTESVQGVTAIWGCSLVICILCSVMLTTRAALYNTTRKRKKRERKPKRVVEKEFEEYKEYMREFYPDAGDWQFHPPLPTKKATGTDKSEIKPNPTFETASTSGSDEEPTPKNALGVGNDLEPESPMPPMSQLTEFGVEDEMDGYGMEDHVMEDEIYNEEDDDDSSYESDSDESEGSIDDDSQSAFTSFFLETKSVLSETKSLARSVASATIQTIRKIKPLLGGRKDDEDDESREDVLDITAMPFDDQSVILPSPPSSGIFGRSMGGDGLWQEYVTPPTATLSSPARFLMAPGKLISQLARTNETDALAHELDALTRTPSNSQPLSPSEGHVRPRRLRLSPFAKANAAPDEGSESDEDRRDDQDGKGSPSMLPLPAILGMGSATPAPRLLYTRRQRRDSEDSDNLSLYIEDAPKPPTKPIRMLGRTSASDPKHR